MRVRSVDALALFVFSVLLVQPPPPCFAANGGGSDILRKGPYLSMAVKEVGPTCVDMCTTDNTKMTVLWQTDRTPGSCKIAWDSVNDCTGADYATPGRTAGGLPESDSEKNQHQFAYTISGLSPGTKTCYRVTCDGTDYKGSFRTPPADGSTAISFYAYGDTRGPRSHHQDVLKTILTDMKNDPSGGRQTMILHTGDLVMDGAREDYWDQNCSDNLCEDRKDLGQCGKDAYFKRQGPEAEFLSTLPVLATLGNHEGYTCDCEKDPASGDCKEPLKKKLRTDYENFGKYFKKYFPYPFYIKGKEKFYYAFDYGPARFVIIDGNDRVGDNGNAARNKSDAGLKEGTPQWEWLKKVLGGTTKWKIVAIHNPLYTGSKDRDRFEKDRAMRDKLHAFLKAQGVKVVLQGHNHYYAHCEYDGVHYLTLGSGGCNLTDPATVGPPSCPGSAANLKTAYNTCGPPGHPNGGSLCYHYSRIDIRDDRSMEVTVRDGWGNAAGDLIEHFTVSR